MSYEPSCLSDVSKSAESYVRCKQNVMAGQAGTERKKQACNA
jgi:hypothetical protein